MNRSGPRIAVAGPFPGPRHGMALSTEATAEALGAIDRIDLAAGGLGQTLGDRTRKMSNAVRAVHRCLRRGDWDTLVMAVDSGEGMVVNLALVAIARVRRIRIVLQHHTWAYLRSARWTMRAICKLGGADLTHLFLCERARDDFTAVYGKTGAFHVVGNSFVLPDRRHRPDDDRPITIGHLANLSEPKGIMDVLRIAESLPRSPMIVGGPATDDAARTAVAALRDLDNVTLLGELDDEGVGRFHSDCDIFLLPSRTEAMPLVVWEALAAGSVVIAYDVGCLRAMSAGESIRIVDGVEELERMVTAVITEIASRSTDERRRAHEAAQDRLDRRRLAEIAALGRAVGVPTRAG